MASPSAQKGVALATPGASCHLFCQMRAEHAACFGSVAAPVEQRGIPYVGIILDLHDELAAEQQREKVGIPDAGRQRGTNAGNGGGGDVGHSLTHLFRKG